MSDDVTDEHLDRSGPAQARALCVAAVVTTSSLLLVFGVAVALDLPVLRDPSPAMRRLGAAAAALGLLLLVADVVVPVPSSLVMVANGALFGAVTGTALSVAGSVGAVTFGYAIGAGAASRRSTARGGAGHSAVRATLDRWGTFAVAVTRPVPVLAEATSVLAGVAGLPLRWVVAAATAGAVPVAAAYAVAGASDDPVANGAAVFAGACAAGALLVAGRDVAGRVAARWR